MSCEEPRVCRCESEWRVWNLNNSINSIFFYFSLQTLRASLEPKAFVTVGDPEIYMQLLLIKKSFHKVLVFFSKFLNSRCMTVE